MLAAQPAQNLYHSLQGEFAPLKLARHLEKHLGEIEALDHPSDYTIYIPVLKEVAAVKVLRQVGLM